MRGLHDVEECIHHGDAEDAIANVKSAMEYMVRLQKRVKTFVERVDQYSFLMEGTRSSDEETPHMKRMVSSMLEVKKAVGINGPLDEFEEAVRRENDESDDYDEDDEDDDEGEEEKKEESEDDEDDESDDESDGEEEDVEEVEDDDDEEDEEVVVIEIKDDEEEVVVG